MSVEASSVQNKERPVSASAKRLYLPLDKQFNFFSLTSSKNGIIIPLMPFGYPNHHITLYFKKMENKPSYQKMSIHLTNDLTKKLIYEYFVEFHEESTTTQMTQKFEQLKQAQIDLVKKHLIPIKTPKNQLACYDCLMDHYSAGELNTKNKAKLAFQKLLDQQGKEVFEFKCQKTKHGTLINPKTARMYVRTGRSMLKFDNLKEMGTEFGRKIEEIFTEQLAHITNIQSALAKELKKIKSELK